MLGFLFIYHLIFLLAPRKGEQRKLPAKSQSVVSIYPTAFAFKRTPLHEVRSGLDFGYSRHLTTDSNKASNRACNGLFLSLGIRVYVNMCTVRV